MNNSYPQLLTYLNQNEIAILVNHYSKEIGVKQSEDRLKYFTNQLAVLLK
jgi:hypothetical protein